MSEHSLSKICNCGPRPLLRSMLCIFLVAAKMVAAFLLLMGSANIALLS